jgi:hypothetical protein
MHKRGIDEIRIYGLLDAGIPTFARTKMRDLYLKVSKKLCLQVFGLLSFGSLALRPKLCINLRNF